MAYSRISSAKYAVSVRLYYEYGLIMRNDNEKRILKAIDENDIQKLKDELENPGGCRLGSNNIPILSVAVIRGTPGIIKFLIDNGCDAREIDPYGNATLHLVLSRLGYTSAFSKVFREEFGSFLENESRRLDIVDILLAVSSDSVEAVFSNANEMKMTPFLMACKLGSCQFIMRFLALLESNSVSISIDRFVANEGMTVCHFLLIGLPDNLRALIDKIPYFDQLIDQKNDEGETPLHWLLHQYSSDSVFGKLVEGIKIFFQRGASPDTLDKNGRTYFESAVSTKNVAIVDTVLRAGCITYSKGSPLSYILKDFWRKSKWESIQSIELLLAYGYDLQKELFLYSIDERPIEFTSPEYARFRDTRGMDPDVLEALRGIRRSNKMLSLQRQCRNTIRRHLKGKADEVIENLVCIPEKIKSFLLVKNEEPLLQITGQ